jgi:ABC-2 type transport system ATP-binding protein
LIFTVPRGKRAMIEVIGLTKQYGSATVVNDLSFTVRTGTVTGFLAPNGAGKSTTMRMILGLDTPTKGRALIFGEPYDNLSKPLTKVGSLLDANWIHPNRSARSHLRFLAATNNINAKRVDKVLDTVGLTKVAGRAAGKFSLGMKQRLGLAAALLGDPQILIFDEPVNGLDPEGIFWIRTLMKDLAAEGRAVLVSSHLMSEMALTADHLIVIGAGKLIADSSTGPPARRSGSVRRNSPSSVSHCRRPASRSLIWMMLSRSTRHRSSRSATSPSGPDCPCTNWPDNPDRWSRRSSN